MFDISTKTLLRSFALSGGGPAPSHLEGVDMRLQAYRHPTSPARKGLVDAVPVPAAQGDVEVQRDGQADSQRDGRAHKGLPTFPDEVF